MKKISNLIFDKRYIWHPYTSMTNPLPTYLVHSAFGCKLILDNGCKLIDGMSSWWAAIHGYNHPIINKAMIEQINNMSHVMFGGITHLPAIQLCRRLVELTPKNLECVFLADSGSVAVEVAIKMVLQYWQTLGEYRHELLSFRKGYHGDTFGAMSVCDPDNSMHALYKNYLPLNRFVKITKRFDELWHKNDGLVLSSLIEKYHRSLAAVILEPIVQGAGGMWFYHPEYLRLVRKLCDYYKIPLIADEIATGFGRTGEWFACNFANISPDIMCLGKALTGGTVTLSATLTSRHIAETISNGKAGCFMHGPTFMANPLACAAANASLSILEDESWRAKISMISNCLSDGLNPLIKHYRVHDVRILGAIGVVETKNRINISKIQHWFVNHGVWIRPFGKLIYLMPPYIISKNELSKLIHAITSSLDEPNHFI